MVVVYSKPNCVQCNATYRMLDNLGVKYRVENYEDSEEAQKAVEENGFLSAPIVTNGTDWWAGFNPDRLKECK